MTTLDTPCAALSPIRICDFTGQLAGAGATKTLATFRRAGYPSRGQGQGWAVGYFPRQLAIC